MDRLRHRGWQLSGKNAEKVIGCVFFLASSHIFGAQQSVYVDANICDIIADPSAYSEKHVSISGSVYVGMDRTNISDSHYLGKAVSIVISDDVYKHSDIRSFHRKITGWQMHGVATVLGTVIVTSSPLDPLSLDVHRIINVARSESK